MSDFDVGLRERGRVVDPVGDHRHDVTSRRDARPRGLLFRQQLRLGLEEEP